MRDHLQRHHQNLRLTSSRASSTGRQGRNRQRLLGILAGLTAALPSACSLVLDDYSIDDSLLENGTCQLGEQRCVGDWLLSCAPMLDGWLDSLTCDLPERCDSAGSVCRACAQGEYRCEGASLQLCNADRSAWDTVEACQSSGVCHLNLQACAPCKPGEYQCNGGVLGQCSADGSWGAPTQCGAPELCTVSEDRATGKCLASAKCQAAAYSCQDARLVRCDAQGVAQLGIETCASAVLCQRTLSAAMGDPKLPSCVRPSCDVNQARCEGNQLLVCSPERTGFTQGRMCSGDNPCNPKLRDCGRCSPGEVYCSGPDLLKCDANGVFQRLQTCASSALCRADAAACDAPECDEPGRASCDPTEPLLTQCGDDLRLHFTNCDTPALCNARDRRCEVPACEAGAVRCDGQRLQYCNTARTAWETELTCEAGSFCDPVNGKCVPGACQGTGFRCNDVFLERCTPMGFQRVARCAVPSLCHADTGTCAPPQCMPGTFHCDGKFLKKCNEMRQWMDADVCAGQCDDIAGKCL
jgi:hypothetical protein